jgi:hypothetical protein
LNSGSPKKHWSKFFFMKAILSVHFVIRRFPVKINFSPEVNSNSKSKSKNENTSQISQEIFFKFYKKAPHI